MVENLFGCIKMLEAAGELLRVLARLSPKYEVAAALRRLEMRTGKAILLENIDGYPGQLMLGNLFTRRKRLALLLNTTEDDLIAAYLARTAQPVAARLVEGGLAAAGLTQVSRDLAPLPVLTHHQRDASPYLTTAVIIAMDPDTGQQGMGIHRVQVKSKDKLGIFLGSPPLADFLLRAEAKGCDLEVAIVVGMHPLTWLASVAYAPAGIEKFSLAGALRGKPIELVQCDTVDLQVPVEAEYVIAGRVLAGVREKEGPFGESNGVYLTYDNPVIQVQQVNYRTSPIYHALLPNNHEENTLIGLTWELQNLRSLQQRFPFVRRMHLEEDDWTRAIIQVERENDMPLLDFAGQVLQELYFVKTLVLVDTDINIYDSQAVAFALATRFQPDRDMLVLQDQPALPLDPSATATPAGYRTSKLAMDATAPPAERERFEQISIPDEVVRRVQQKLANE